jgi:tripartite-type tricarboxylate transporter receptor subunit TctC
VRNNMAYNRRRFLKLGSAIAAASAFSRRATADEWPRDKVVRAIIPFNAGASIDILGRLIADPLSQQLGQTIVIENRGGAGGTLGALQVARATPDGYTLLITSSNHSVAPAIYPNLAYDTANDFAGVALFGTVPNVLLVAASSGIRTAEDLVAKAKSGNVTFSSSGVGSASHWAAERFRISAGFKATHVPYRGGLESLTEVIAGRIDFCCIGVPPAIPFIKEGTALPLLSISLRRSASLPNVKTSIEAGYKDSDYTFWNGLLAPAKTPRPIVERLHAKVTSVLAMPEIQKKLEVQGVEPSPVTSTEYDAQIRREIAENARIAKEAGL